jgi:hypothetical protein
MTSDVEEDNVAFDGWYFYDDTIDHGKLQKNPKRCKLPSGSRYKGYHVRSWYYITRQTLETRTLDRHDVDEIQTEISHLSNYEMIKLLNVTNTEGKKRSTKPKNKPHNRKTPRNFIVVSESEEETDRRPLSQKRNRRQDPTDRSPKQKKVLWIPFFGNFVQKDHNKTAVDTID